MPYNYVICTIKLRADTYLESPVFQPNLAQNILEYRECMCSNEGPCISKEDLLKECIVNM